MGDIKTGSVQITGLAALERKLMALPDKLALNVMRGAVRAGAVVVQREAKARCPAGKQEFHWLGKKGSKGRWLIQAGELKRKGIRVRLAPRKNRSVPIEYWVYVSKRYWHWKFLEFSTVKMKGQPFMRPAFDTMKSKATEAIRGYAAARIDKEVAKLRG